MNIRQTQVLFTLVTTLFCTIAFSSTFRDMGPDQEGLPTWYEATGDSESVTHDRLLLAKVEKVYICQIKENGQVRTSLMPEDEAIKKSQENPKEWILGRCEETFSESS